MSFDTVVVYLQCSLWNLVAFLTMPATAFLVLSCQGYGLDPSTLPTARAAKEAVDYNMGEYAFMHLPDSDILARFNGIDIKKILLEIGSAEWDTGAGSTFPLSPGEVLQTFYDPNVDDEYDYTKVLLNGTSAEKKQAQKYLNDDKLFREGKVKGAVIAVSSIGSMYLFSIVKLNNRHPEGRRLGATTLLKVNKLNVNRSEPRIRMSTYNKYVHSIMICVFHGKMPPGESGDHYTVDSHDNRATMLRPASTSMQQQNKNKAGSSLPNGISISTPYGRFGGAKVCTIQHMGYKTNIAVNQYNSLDMVVKAAVVELELMKLARVFLD